MKHPLLESRDLLNAYSILDAHISGMNVPRAILPTWQRILITGSTGFIGGFLLLELLANTNAKIYCLIRGASQKEAKERLVTNLQKKGTWKEEYRSRLHIILGDLNLPKLGLCTTELMQLADTVDVIFHLGASTKWLSNYSSQSQANVLNFKELLILATVKEIIPIHHFSSMSIFASTNTSFNKPILESEIFQEPGSLFGGYCQSKWVCEKIIEQARMRNIPINVYRIGEANGNSTTGMCDSNNFINLLIYFCLLTHVAPKSYRYTRFNLVPVDYLTKAILHISTHIQDNGKTYQFSSSQIFTLEEMVDEMNKCGFDVTLVSDEVWKQALCDKSPLAKKMKTIFKKLNIDLETKGISLFDIGQSLFSRDHDTSNTDKALIGSNVKCPKVIDDGILNNYFHYNLAEIPNFPPANAFSPPNSRLMPILSER